MPELGQQTYAPVNGYFERTAGLTPEVRAGAAKQMIDVAEAAGTAEGKLFVAGFLQANAGASAVATSRGLFAYHRSSSAWVPRSTILPTSTTRI